MPDRLGLTLFQFERARKDDLIPPPDVNDERWSVAVFEAVQPEVEEIRAATGELPDMGAGRAAEVLQERLGVSVEPDVLIELDRQGLIPRVGDYKGHALYDGRALEQFADTNALTRAHEQGRLLARDEVAAHLRVRRSDVEQLLMGGWLEPVTWVHSRHQRRGERPVVPLFRYGDLVALLEHPAIDWEQVRATPKGRPSVLARLTASATG